MASDNSAKPILIAGAFGAVALLAVAWMYAAASGDRAEREAIARVEAENQENESAGEPVQMAEATAEAASEPTESNEETTEEAEAADAGKEPEEKAEESAEVEEPAKTTETETAMAEPEKAEEAKEEDAKVEEAKAEEPETEEAKAEEPEAEEPAAEEAKAEEAEAEEPQAEEVVQTASVAGDPEAGKKVFRKCKACHKVGDGAKNAVGPQLNGVMGREVGGLGDFSYSKVFEEANAAGKVWTPEDLDAYLEAPRKVMKGTKMAFGGLRKENDRTNVIAYLATFE